MVNEMRVYLNNVDLDPLTTIVNGVETDVVLYPSDMENPWIFERINGEYTFAFVIRDEGLGKIIRNDHVVFVDDDYFIIVGEDILHGEAYEKKYTCEHYSYKLNFHDEDSDELETEITYTGTVYGIIPQMLAGTNFNYTLSDDTPGNFTFTTKKRGIRARIIEFCTQMGFEANFYRFSVTLQVRRGYADGPEIRFGKNIRRLRESRILNFDKTEDVNFDLDYVDLNYVTDLDGNMLSDNDLHMGDTVYIYTTLDEDEVPVVKRAVAVGYNPFEHALPTVELSDNLIARDLAQQMLNKNSGGGTSGSGSGNNGGNVPKTQFIFGVKIDETNSNPETALTYTNDAVDLTPAHMNFETDTFSYGSWQDKFPFNQIKPCLLKDGAVVGYLNPNNYTQFEDGSPVDITSGNNGDVMIEFPKIWWSFERIGTELHVSYANYKASTRFNCYAHKLGDGECSKIYISAYMGWRHTVNGSVRMRSLSGMNPVLSIMYEDMRNNAKSNGQNYEQMGYYQNLMLQILYTVMFKNLNSQQALGSGKSSDYSGLTGTLNTKGLFYGTNATNKPMKFCGIEEWYGGVATAIDGFVVDTGKIKIAVNNQNYQNYNSYELVETIPIIANGYINKVSGSNKIGFMPVGTLGSSTTFYSDHFKFKAGLVVLFFGGHGLDGTGVGAFRYDIDRNITEGANYLYGSRIMCFGGVT